MLINILEEGYVKYQSNISKMRNYITTHRCDDSFSSLYAAHEDTFISIGQGKDNGKLSETIYRLDKKEKALMESFMYVRNNGMTREVFKRRCHYKMRLISGKPKVVNQKRNHEIYRGTFNDYLFLE